jgi:hypothetical protein
MQYGIKTIAMTNALLIVKGLKKVINSHKLITDLTYASIITDLIGFGDNYINSHEMKVVL